MPCLTSLWNAASCCLASLRSGGSAICRVTTAPSSSDTTSHNEQWLTPVTLSGSSGGATASLVDEDGIYVAYGTNVMRYSLDGSNPNALDEHVPNGVHGIHSDGNLLFINHSSGLYARLISINKDTNALIDTMESYVDSIYGSSISTTANRIFGRSTGHQPG